MRPYYNIYKKFMECTLQGTEDLFHSIDSVEVYHGVSDKNKMVENIVT